MHTQSCRQIHRLLRVESPWTPSSKYTCVCEYAHIYECTYITVCRQNPTFLHLDLHMCVSVYMFIHVNLPANPQITPCRHTLNATKYVQIRVRICVFTYMNVYIRLPPNPHIPPSRRTYVCVYVYVQYSCVYVQICQQSKSPHSSI